MSEESGLIFGLEKKDIVKYAAYTELALLGWTGFRAMGLEAPKFVVAATGVATTVQADALKAGTTDTYMVSNVDITKVRTKANLDALLAANQIENLACKTQSTIFYPIVGALFPILDIKVEKSAL